MSDIQQCQLCGADLVAGGSDINAELAKRDAEIERLRDVIDRAAKAWLSLDPAVAFEGDVGGAMVAAVAEVGRLRGALAREEQEHNIATKMHAVAVKERNFERVLSLRKDAEIKQLRDALRPMIQGVYWITDEDVVRARTALGVSE